MSALQLIEELIAVMPHPRWQRFLREMHQQLQLPMADVLAKVPGDSVAEKARFLDVSRNTYYEWQNESFRPSLEQARRLEELTGFPAAQIHGETDDDAGRAVAGAAAGVGQAGAEVPSRPGRVRRSVGRVVSQQRKRGDDRKVVARARRRSIRPRTDEG